MPQYEEKKQKLIREMDFYAKQDVAVAFSGGADSSLLLKLACSSAEKTGRSVYAVTIRSELQSAQDLESAQKVAQEIGAVHKFMQISELDEAGIRNNPKERCYLCKRYMFVKLKEFAGKYDIEIILEGTNADDCKSYRPGIRAIKELQIKSPLSDAGFTKEEVRRMAYSSQISVAGRPSAPCLATRFPYGTELTAELFQKVEQGEAYLKSMGMQNIRIRVYGPLIRIETEPDSIHKLLENRDKVIAYMKSLGFVYITVDLEGFRSGSMDCV